MQYQLSTLTSFSRRALSGNKGHKYIHQMNHSNFILLIQACFTLFCCSWYMLLCLFKLLIVTIMKVVKRRKKLHSKCGTLDGWLDGTM
jgi:hypothetical protein